MKPEEISETIERNGKMLICSHCSNTRFFTLKGEIKTISKIKWGFEQLRHPTTCYVCSECNKMSEFLDR